MATSTTNHWKLGLFVLTGLVALMTVAVWFGAKHFEKKVLTT